MLHKMLFNFSRTNNINTFSPSVVVGTGAEESGIAVGMVPADAALPE